MYFFSVIRVLILFSVITNQYRNEYETKNINRTENCHDANMAPAMKSLFARLGVYIVN